MSSTYEEMITRAVVLAHQQMRDMPLDRLRMSAEAVFPSVEEELAIAVSMNPGHSWRSVLKDQTTALTNGAEIPQVSTNGKQIIGVYGAVLDASDSKELSTDFTLDEIRRINENPNSWRKISVYAYQIVKPRIFHTRTSVTIDVCVYDVEAQKTAIAANQVPLFPDAEGAYVSALVAKLTGKSLFDADLQGQITLATMTK